MNLANRAMKVKETVTWTLTVLAILFVGKTTAGDLIQHLPQHMIAVKKVGVLFLDFNEQSIGACYLRNLYMTESTLNYFGGFFKIVTKI